MNTHELIETQSRDVPSPWKTTRLQGEVQGAKSFLATCRASLDFLSGLQMRIGKDGDDPVDVYTDITLLLLRQNDAVESVLRAEGILACAQRRLDDWTKALVAEMQEDVEAEEIRQQALKSETPEEQAHRERLEDEQGRIQAAIENAEVQSWGTGSA